MDMDKLYTVLQVWIIVDIDMGDENTIGVVPSLVCFIDFSKKALSQFCSLWRKALKKIKKKIAKTEILTLLIPG